MEVNKVNTADSSGKESILTQKNNNAPIIHNGENSPINNLINLMASINESTFEAELNEISISDGNGGRILL